MFRVKNTTEPMAAKVTREAAILNILLIGLSFFKGQTCLTGNYYITKEELWDTFEVFRLAFRKTHRY
jgi:hypothetical protein